MIYGAERSIRNQRRVSRHLLLDCRQTGNNPIISGLPVGRVQRSQQDGVDKTPGWRLGPDSRKSIGGYGFTAKVEWL
jgi:hypothetical protein